MKPLKEVISIDSEVCKVLPYISEKFLVDFANSIDVTHDHIRTQKERNSFFSRCIDGFTGKGVQRQTLINSSVNDAAKGALEWLAELTEDLELGEIATAKVNDEVAILEMEVSSLAEGFITTRKKLNLLAEELSFRMCKVEQDVARIDFIQRVQNNLDEVFYSWEAGHSIKLSIGGRCYAAAEELRWGAFGYYCSHNTGKERDKFVKQAINRAVIQMAKDANVTSNTRLSVYDNWLKLPVFSSMEDDLQEGLAYSADGFDAETAPIIISLTQDLPERLVRVPLIASASRLAEAIIDEVFMEVLND